MKKVHIFMLMLLLIGQTILGPIATVSASEIDPPITSSEEKNIENQVDDGDQESEITETPTGDACGEEQKVDVESLTSEEVAGIEIDGNKLGESVEDCEHPTHSIMISDNDTEVDPSVIHTITTDKNLSDPSYRPKMGDEITLELKFTLPSEHKYGEGSTLTYKLPEPLKAVRGSGDLSNNEVPPVKYGSYFIDNGQVFIIFNDEIRFQGEEGSGGIETNGYFNIQAKFESDNKELDQELTLPKNGEDETVTLHFQPKGGNKVTKSFSAENDGKNSEYVKWTVEVNTVMDDLGAGVEFTDTLTGKHKYDPTSLKVTQKTLGTDGLVIGEENDVTNEFLPLDTGSNSFTLSLTGKYAYTIEYQTIPEDSDEAHEVLGNTASFNGAKDPQSTTIKYGLPLSKSVSQNGEKANWKITVNANRRPLEAGLTITDTWITNSDEHELVGTINVNNLTIDTDYEVTTSKTGFILKLLKPVSDEFTIEYTTQPKDLVTGNIPLTNEVVRGDRKDDKAKATASYSQNVIAKSNSNINYQSKTVDWKIVLNSAGYTMSNIVLDDVFVEQNLTIVDGTFKVMMNGLELPSEFTHKDGPTTGDKKGGFELKIEGPISSPITITYTTEYDVRGTTNLETYTNVGDLKWDDNKYSVNNITSTVDINSQQKGKGYKTGVYNYEHKKFEWSVGINYNFDNITNATFTDTLSDSQVIDRDSIKVYKLDLTSGGNGKHDKENPLSEGEDYLLTPDELENSFTITFNKEINDAYLINYESRNKHDFYEPNRNKETVKNNAELTGTTSTGPYSGTWKKDVTVEHTEKLITKNASQVNGSAMLDWTLNLNWGQSTLKDAVIKDTIGNDDEGNPNQIVNKDSFQICEMDFSDINPKPIEGKCHEPGTGLYDVFFENLNDPAATFEIKFNQELTKAYVVKYETYFLGASGEKVINNANLSYSSNDETGAIEDEANFDKSFTFSGGADAKKGQLEITKVDKDNTDLKLSGAKFELWSAETGGFLIERVSTDVDGVYTFQTKVGQGTYYLVETQAPSGYSLGESEYKDRKSVSIKDKGDSKTPNYVENLIVENEKIHQAVKLVKVDGVSEVPLKGAEFELYNTDGNIVKDKEGSEIRRTTDDNGEITVNNLDPGDYYFLETKAPEHYFLDEEKPKTIEFTIIEDQTKFTDVTMDNKRGKGSLIIIKQDVDTKTKLSDTEFELTNSNGDVVGGKKTTDADGKLEYLDLPYDIYTLKETKAKPGYVIDGQEHTIVVSDAAENGKEFSKTITNKKITRSVQLIKYNANKSLVLPNAVFELRKMDERLPVGYEVVSTIDPKKLMTDENGKIYLDGLEMGDYQFVETKAPSGYYVNREPVEFTITPNQTSTVHVEKTNNRIPDPTWPVEPGKPVDSNKPDKEDPKDPEKENPTNPDKEDPENPTEPETPEVEDDSDERESDGSNEGTTGDTTTGKPGSPSPDSGKAGNGNQATLPQTGEQHLLYMILLGFAFMAIGGFMAVRRKTVE